MLGVIGKFSEKAILQNSKNSLDSLIILYLSQTFFSYMLSFYTQKPEFSTLVASFFGLYFIVFHRSTN